jgi:hypothetical protein
MLDKPEEINNIIASKSALKYHGDNIDAILAIGNAAKNRSLKEFNEVEFITFISIYNFRHLDTIVKNCNVILSFENTLAL